MTPQILTLEDAQHSLSDHIATKGCEIREKYGPSFGWRELHLMLEDRNAVRYPCEIVFDDGPLRDGEFAHPVANGPEPEAGFRMYVHPFFSLQTENVPAIVLYQLVLVNYGDFASPEDAETFGASVLGISREEYYDQLCELADLVSQGVSTMEPAALNAGGGGCHGGACGCGS